MNLGSKILKSLNESEVHTVDNDPAWAEAVAKVNKEYEENKPEIIEELKKELKAYKNKMASEGYSKEEIKELPMIKAYEDAIKDPDDIWCECGKYAGEDLYKDDGEVYLGVEKHGWICPNCSKYTQIG